MALQLILARHGLTDWNVAGKIQGHKGMPLNRTGSAQALQLGQVLKDLVTKGELSGIQAIFCSDLPRAVQTASLAAQYYLDGLAVRQDPRLRECAFGTLEGKTLDQVFGLYGDEIVPHFKDWAFEYDFVRFQGESRTQVLQRHLECLDHIRSLHAGETVLVVGHGRSLNTLLQNRWGEVPRIEENCAYRIVTY